MKRFILIIISLILIFSLSSCNVGVVQKLDGEFEDYYYESSKGIKTVTNYHPYNVSSLPTYQEMIQFGDGAGLENEGKVYFIYVVDTSKNPDSDEAYYTAEFDATTRAMLCESGEYFTDEETKNETLKRLFEVFDSIE